MRFDRIDWRERFPAASLGLFMLLAGLSKFFIIEYWTGYEPQILVKLMMFNAENLVLLGGVFETALGAILIVGRKTEEISLAISVYLLMIVLQLVRLELWDLVIRDLGLFFFSLSVYLRSGSSRKML